LTRTREWVQIEDNEFSESITFNGPEIRQEVKNYDLIWRLSLISSRNKKTEVVTHELFAIISHWGDAWNYDRATLPGGEAMHCRMFSSDHVGRSTSVESFFIAIPEAQLSEKVF
jgi:hypothetical protein